MESKNAWEKYSDKELKKVDKFAEEYREFLSECKTERECVVRFRELAEKQGYVDLQDIIKGTAEENDIELFEGIYAQLTGPSFESPAEIQMLHKLGASAVGMSTVVEAIAANHMGMKICGVSCVSNLAAGMNSAPLTHEEVQEAANAVAPKFEKLLTETITKFKELV